MGQSVSSMGAFQYSPQIHSILNNFIGIQYFCIVNMASTILKMSVPVATGLALEQFVLRSQFPLLYQSNWLTTKAYSGVVLVNVIGSSIIVLILGFKVSAARRIYKEEAIIKGDKDAEDRFSYPKVNIFNIIVFFSLLV